MNTQNTIGEYMIIRKIGRGATSKVKLAQKIGSPEKLYAIKEISKAQFEVRPGLQQKIRQEIALLHMIQHPNIVNMVDVYESQNRIYIVFEYAPNGELLDYMINSQISDLSSAMSFFRELLYALEYIHQYGICHRDLKPENLLLDKYNHIKLVDFGFARWMKSDIADTSCGSPHYASPEIIKGIQYDGRKADIWSAGVILYALCVGKLPFDDTKMRGLMAKIRSGQYETPSFLPEDVQDLIARLLTVEPDQRISIAQIKRHPAFLRFLPREYQPPVPDTIPIINKPIPSDEINEESIALLLQIGFSTKDEIIDLLTATEHNMAKVFFTMLNNRRILTRWDNQSSGSSDSEMTMSPSRSLRLSGILLDQEDIDVFSSSFGSLNRAVRTQLPKIDSGIQPTNPAQDYLDIPLRMEVLITGIQQYLTENNFLWLHPDPLHIYAKTMDYPGIYDFSASYESENSINLSIANAGVPVNESYQLEADIESLIKELLL